MPICSYREVDEQVCSLLWRISEPEEVLLQTAVLDPRLEIAYRQITHTRRRREWLATRAALRHLLTQLGHERAALCQDKLGKPYLTGSNMQISLAHCEAYAYVAAAQGCAIGVDIQKPCTSLQRVQHRFLQEEETAAGIHDLDTLCVYWCAKEAIYKAQGGQEGLLRDIYINPFVADKQGILTGHTHKQTFSVHYRWYNGHVLARSNAIHGGSS
ncbi:MAG: 4'-phosphopantetheinyl transferase superfamily protein [Bacteroidota bacterium]